MLDSVQEAINDICIECGEEGVEVQDNPKSPSSKGSFNVVVSVEARADLVKRGWSHRGVVGANIYFLKGAEKIVAKEEKKVVKSASKKLTSRKK